MATQTIGRRAIALVHVARAQLGLDEPTYREMLESVGVRSSTELTYTKFHELMRRFEAGGFVRSDAVPVRRQPTRERRPLVRKIESMLRDLDLPWAYADGISQRMFGVERAWWCSPEQLHKIVAALMIYKKRRRGGECK